MKFNESTSTTNLAGGHAHDVSDPLEALRTVTINQLFESRYYEDDTESLRKLSKRFERAADEDPEFPLQLAAYARQEAYVRDVPQVLLVLSCYHDDASEYVRQYATQIIDRADELCTALAFNNIVRRDAPDDFTAPVPRTLKRALADVIESGKFDEYEYAKYRRDSRAVSMRDVFNVTHPFGYDDSPNPTDVIVKSGDSETTMYYIGNAITKGERDDHSNIEPLRQRRTWEDRLSRAGEQGDVGAAEWIDVLDDMGMFARIRNLRNMLEAGVDGERIVDDMDDEWIRNSQLYPFRFYQARKALKRAGLLDDSVHSWLEDAIDVACETIPDELTYTASVVDLSGSMSNSLSDDSTLQMDEIGALFGAMLGSRDASVIGFASSVETLARDPLQSNSVLTMQERIRRMSVGSNTFAHKAIEHLADSGSMPDRVVIFTDFQIWERNRYGNDPNALREAWENLRSNHPEQPHLYIVDLASYGEIKLPESYPHVTRLQGWDDNVLDYIWHNEHSMLEDITNYAPDGHD